MFRTLAVASVLAVTTGLGIASSATAATGPVLAEFGITGSASQDVTTKAGSLGIRAHLTDDGAGIASARVWLDDVYTYTPLKLTAGTAKDGVWTGTLPLPGGIGGVRKLNLEFGAQGATSTVVHRSEQLAARGFASTVATKVTAAPSTPVWTVATTQSGGYVRASWSNSWPGQPIASAWQVTAGGACLPGTVLIQGTEILFGKSVPGVCTVTVRPGNTAGFSKTTSSASAILF